jgi:ribosomal-protein-alanine N-acetyltransferase
VSPPVIRLVTPDLALLDAALAGRQALADALGCQVAEGWEVFPGALRATREAAVAHPDSWRWGTRLFVLDEPETVVGWGGFKGPPRDGAVELGYAIAPAWERRGLATAAVAELLREAFATPQVETVFAHTQAKPGASARVLEKSGFVNDGEVPDDELGKAWRFRLTREGGDALHGR